MQHDRGSRDGNDPQAGVERAGLTSIRIKVKGFARAERRRRAHRVRQALTKLGQAYVEYLNEVDGDPDYEPDADAEPSLGWPEPGDQVRVQGEDIED